MSEKIERALNYLNDVLPLKKRQDRCENQIKLLYQKILLSFITTGRILSKFEMTKYVSNVEDAIQVLEENEMLIISENGDPIGAYPFTMEERENIVCVNGFQINAMCALDALAISPMYDVDVQIHTQCRITNIPIYLEQSGANIVNLNGTGDICVCIAWEAAEKDIKCANSLCMEMFFVNDKKTATTWQKIETEKREVFTLEEAVEFASRFFVPLVS